VAFVRSEHPCERLKSSPSHLEDGAGQNAGSGGCVRDRRHRPTRGRRRANSIQTTGLAPCTAIEGFGLQTPHPHRMSPSVDFLSPAHLAPVPAIADFRLLAPPARGYCTRRYSRPRPTWLKSLQSKGLSAILTPLGVPAGVHVLAGPSVWPQKLRSAVRASGPPPSATRQARMSQ